MSRVGAAVPGAPESSRSSSPFGLWPVGSLLGHCWHWGRSAELGLGHVGSLQAGVGSVSPPVPLGTVAVPCTGGRRPWLGAPRAATGGSRGAEARSLLPKAKLRAGVWPRSTLGRVVVRVCGDRGRAGQSLAPWRASPLGGPRSSVSLGWGTTQCPQAPPNPPDPPSMPTHPLTRCSGRRAQVEACSSRGAGCIQCPGSRRLSSLVCREAEGAGFVRARAEMALGGKRASTACQPRGEAGRREKRATNA